MIKKKILLGIVKLNKFKNLKINLIKRDKSSF